MINCPCCNQGIYSSLPWFMGGTPFLPSQCKHCHAKLMVSHFWPSVLLVYLATVMALTAWLYLWSWRWSLALLIASFTAVILFFRKRQHLVAALQRLVFLHQLALGALLIFWVAAELSWHYNGP